MNEWKDIGEQLRAAREAKELDLKSISESTRIPVKTLQALEESDYSIFANPTYARSFLSQYSEHLGVDADEWVDSFETGDVLSHDTDHAHFTQTSSISSSEGKAPLVDRSALIQTLTVILITIALLVGGYYIYKKIESSLGDAAVEQNN